MKVLVTGRHGQLARSLRERAVLSPDLRLSFVGRPEIDLSDPDLMAAAIERLSPDVVINAAAYTAVDQAEDEPELAYRLNADAAAVVAATTARIGAAIVQISTDYVFDGSSDRPYVEDVGPNPLNVYGASKLAGEEQAKAANPRHVILRTSWVISPFGRNFASTMVEGARQRDTLRVVADQRGKPTSALDLADAILALLARAEADGLRYGTYHVAGGGEASWFDLAQAVMEECRRLGARAANVEPIASADWPTRAKRPENSVLDCSKARRELGLELRPWRTSLSEIVQKLVTSEDAE